MGSMQTKNRWVNHEAKKTLAKINHLFGPPNQYLNQPHGYAIWDRNTLKRYTLFNQAIPFDCLIIDDNLIPDHRSYKHHDFMYLIVQIPLTREQIRILSSFENIAYDHRKIELTVRCHSLETTILRLTFISELLRLRKLRRELDLLKIYHNDGSINLPYVEKKYKECCEHIIVLKVHARSSFQRFEHLEPDPRFAIDPDTFHYDIGSQVNTTGGRVYGTVAQKINYPKYTDLITGKI